MEKAFTPPAERRHNVALWAAILLAPAAWALQLQVVYALVPLACSTGRQSLLHIPTALLLLAALAGAGNALRVWLQDGAAEASKESVKMTPRAQFMAGVGIMSSILFCIVIVAQWIPTIFISPCQGLQ